MVSSKKCFKCLQDLPLVEFYVHKGMKDGRLNKCKACTKSDVSAYRADNIEKVRKYDRERASLPERKRQAKKISSAWRKRDKRRVACHNAVARAVRSGKLKASPCERCGSANSIAHHESYDRKLDVTWLCQPCHKQRHKEMAIEGIDP